MKHYLDHHKAEPSIRKWFSQFILDKTCAHKDCDNVKAFGTIESPIEPEMYIFLCKRHFYEYLDIKKREEERN